MVLVLLNYNYPNDELLINKHKSSKNDLVIHETTNSSFTASGFQFIRPEFIKHAYETRPLCCPHFLFRRSPYRDSERNHNNYLTANSMLIK